MSLTIIPRNDAGKVYIQDTTIIWDAEGGILLKVAIADIKIIGEYTTVHALHINEWFLVVVLSETEMFQISMYAKGMQEVLRSLSETLGKLEPRLADERDFKSNAIWPHESAGQELYELKVIESKTWFDRFRARLGFGNPVELVLREPLKAKL